MSEHEWLRDLKPGDVVIVSGRNGESIRKVDHITPTGRIKIGESTFNSVGSLISTDKWATAHLIEATPERVEEIRKSRIIANAIRAAHDIKNISYEQAVGILSILKGETT